MCKSFWICLPFHVHLFYFWHTDTPHENVRRAIMGDTANVSSWFLPNDSTWTVYCQRISIAAYGSRRSSGTNIQSNVRLDSFGMSLMGIKFGKTNNLESNTRRYLEDDELISNSIQFIFQCWIEIQIHFNSNELIVNWSVNSTQLKNWIWIELN